MRRGQFVVHQFDELLPRRDALQHLGADRLFLHRLAELLYHAVIDVGLQKRAFDVAHRLGDVLFRELAPAADLFENSLESIDSSSNIQYGNRSHFHENVKTLNWDN